MYYTCVRQRLDNCGVGFITTNSLRFLESKDQVYFRQGRARHIHSWLVAWRSRSLDQSRMVFMRPGRESNLLSRGKWKAWAMNLFLLVENRPESVQDFVGIENFSSSSSVLVGPRLVKLIRAMDLCLESRADRNAVSTMCSSSGLLHPRINT